MLILVCRRWEFFLCIFAECKYYFSVWTFMAVCIMLWILEDAYISNGMIKVSVYLSVYQFSTVPLCYIIFDHSKWCLNLPGCVKDTLSYFPRQKSFHSVVLWAYPPQHWNKQCCYISCFNICMVCFNIYSMEQILPLLYRLLRILASSWMKLTFMSPSWMTLSPSLENPTQRMSLLTSLRTTIGVCVCACCAFVLWTVCVFMYMCMCLCSCDCLIREYLILLFILLCHLSCLYSLPDQLWGNCNLTTCMRSG